jgi:hypothetical protein
MGAANPFLLPASATRAAGLDRMLRAVRASPVTITVPPETRGRGGLRLVRKFPVPPQEIPCSAARVICLQCLQPAGYASISGTTKPTSAPQSAKIPCISRKIREIQNTREISRSGKKRADWSYRLASLFWRDRDRAVADAGRDPLCLPNLAAEGGV